MGVTVRFCSSAGPHIGRGHLTRALSLAEGAWPEAVDLELELTEGSPSPAERARADAAGLRLVGTGSAPADGTVCVLDLPDPTSAASSCDPARLVVFDDSERFDGRAAAVVQPSMPSWHGRAQADRVLAGYGWAPIGASWRSTVGRERTTERDRPNVLVCFGGSDPQAVTARLAPSIAADPEWTTTVVVGHGYEGPRPSGIEIVEDPADLPARVADAEMVVLGAGTMKFEVAAVGRPALLVAAADDQLAVGSRLRDDRRGALAGRRALRGPGGGPACRTGPAG